MITNTRKQVASLSFVLALTPLTLLSAEAHGRYSIKVRAEATQLTLTRVLELAPPGPLLQPQDFPAFRQFGQVVMRDLRAQVVY